MTPEQMRIIEALLMKRAGESGDPRVGMKRAGMSAPYGAPTKNVGTQAPPWDPMTSQLTDRQMASRARMGYALDKEQKRADMSSLSPEARQQYLRQSFVAPGMFPDRGMNGGPGGGDAYMRQFLRGSRPIWLQEAINNGDYDPEYLERLMRGG